MSPPPSGPTLPLLPSFACSAVAACIAEATTIPLDTANVRLQTQGGALKAGEAPKYRHAARWDLQRRERRAARPLRRGRSRALPRPRCAQRAVGHGQHGGS